jgi:hypothetical protein
MGVDPETDGRHRSLVYALSMKSGRVDWRAVGLLWMSCAGMACTPDSPDYESACATATDGQCDELSSCPLGSDAVDCEAACESEPWGALAGVCAHYRAEPMPEDWADASLGSGGTGGEVGTWDGTVTVRGAYSNSEVDRHYRVYAPRRNNPDRPTPVVFVLGGFTVDMYWLAEFTELNRLADREDIVVVYGQPEWRDFTSYWVFGW